MTLADLIKKADGLSEDAMLSRAVIFRYRDDLTPMGTHVDLNDVLSGKQQLLLQREDSVVVFSKLALKEHFTIKISGEVNNPGYYKFVDSLHIEDLILMASGMKDAATFQRVEVARRIRGKEFNAADSAVAIVAQFDIQSELKEMSDFILQPFDEVTVRKSPTYNEQENVKIDGAVVYPGTYVINSNRERISSVLQRAGGLKPEAYPAGAVLLRKHFPMLLTVPCWIIKCSFMPINLKTVLIYKAFNARC